DAVFLYSERQSAAHGRIENRQGTHHRHIGRGELLWRRLSGRPRSDHAMPRTKSTCPTPSAWPTRSPISDQTSTVRRVPTESVPVGPPASIDPAQERRAPLSSFRRCSFRRMPVGRAGAEAARKHRRLPCAFARRLPQRGAIARSESRQDAPFAAPRGGLCHQVTSASPPPFP